MPKINKQLKSLLKTRTLTEPEIMALAKTADKANDIESLETIGLSIYTPASVLQWLASHFCVACAL
jgi:DNA-binding FadR family transcriptional regulator